MGIKKLLHWQQCFIRIPVQLVGMLVLILWASAVSLAAVRERPIRVLEPASISCLRFFSKAKFDQQYPGQYLYASQLQPGWYVSYAHESLHYYFGPIALRATASDYQAQLVPIIADAVATRPSIQGYELKLSCEPEPKLTLAATAQQSTPASVAVPPESGFWGLISRIFNSGE